MLEDMALVADDAKTSPHALRLVCSADGTGTGSFSQNALVAYCAEGPLKQFLRTLSTAQFNALNDDMRLRISITPVGTAVAVRAQFAAGTLDLQAAAATTRVDVTLELAHSAIR